MLRGGLPFSPGDRAAGSGLCCSRGLPHANLDCRLRFRSLPGFHRAPWLMQLGLSSGLPQRSPFPIPCHPSTRQAPARASVWCRRGDSNSHGSPHYALNVARLPFRHFGASLHWLEPELSTFASWSRPPDSNRRPAVYETAALPTELGRQVPTAPAYPSTRLPGATTGKRVFVRERPHLRP